MQLVYDKFTFTHYLFDFELNKTKKNQEIKFEVRWNIVSAVRYTRIESHFCICGSMQMIANLLLRIHMERDDAPKNDDVARFSHHLFMLVFVLFILDFSGKYSWLAIVDLSQYVPRVKLLFKTQS